MPLANAVPTMRRRCFDVASEPTARGFTGVAAAGVDKNRIEGKDDARTPRRKAASIRHANNHCVLCESERERF